MQGPVDHDRTLELHSDLNGKPLRGFEQQGNMIRSQREEHRLTALGR